MTDYFAQIMEHAEASPNREACGFLLLDTKGSLEVRKTSNSAGANDKWQIHPAEHLNAVNTGRLFGMYHTHIGDDDEKPSGPDKQCAEVALLPMFIYSLKTRKFSYYRPRATIKPFENREFIAGVQDCASLIIDYYEVNWGVAIPHCARTPQNIKEGIGLLEDYLNGIMQKVPTDSMQKDDLLTFSIGNKGRENHVGIYLGDGRILHQLMGRPSEARVLTPAWRNQIINVMRLK